MGRLRRFAAVPRLYCALLLAVLGAGSIAHAASTRAVERGWLPLVRLAGTSNSAQAVPTLRAVAQLWQTVLHHTQVDTATGDFLQRANHSLKELNLRRMYELLPDKDGQFHQLSVSAAAAAGRYQVGRGDGAASQVGPQSQRQQLGDASLLLRAAPVAASDGDTNYLMQARAGVVVWPADWGAIVGAAQELAHVLESAEDDTHARPLVALRQSVLADNPKLGPEDVEPLATLWEAFPRMGNLVSAIGGSDDLIAATPAQTPGVQHVRAHIHLDPNRMRARYPELARYLRHLDKLLGADLRWLDSHNRTLATLHLDSQTLGAELELYAKDGAILPSVQQVPLVDQQLDTSLGVYAYSLHASANLRILGVRSRLQAIRVDFEHERTERGMQLRGRITQVPSVQVSGAALGFIPTGLIDAVIPGNMQGLFEKSLTTACKGNLGKGVELHARYDRRPGGNATIDGAVAVEAVDNFLVKLGVGYFSDHLMPDDDVRADTARLMTDMQSAFTADLERYARAQPETRSR